MPDPHSDLESLARRVARLERVNQWLITALLLVAIFAGLFAVLRSVSSAPAQHSGSTPVVGSPAPIPPTPVPVGEPIQSDYITARAIRLKDAAGVTRIIMGPTDDGTTGLVIMDTSENSRISLALTPEGEPTLTFLDPQGHQRMVLGSIPGGGAGLNLKGHEQIGLVATPSGSAKLLIQDESGSTVLGQFP